MFGVSLQKLALFAFLAISFIFVQISFAECLPDQIDINQASKEQLEELTGIGPAYAQRIIEGRPFASLDDLTKVKGIGEVTLEKIKNQGRACVQQSAPSASSSPPETASSSSQASSSPPSAGAQLVPHISQPSQEEIFKTNHPPQAKAGENITVNIGTVIHFDGSASKDEDNDPLTFEWNLGNGIIKDQPIFKYSYQYPGQYVVVLTVSDGQLMDSDTLVVKVYPGKVVLSEILPNPTGKDQGQEWVELTNLSKGAVNLSGWKIQTGTQKTKSFIFPKNSLFLPDSFLVLDSSATKLTLTNQEGKVSLLYPSGDVADEVVYQKAQEGVAAARKGSNFFWTDFPTPGTENIIFTAKTTPQNKKNHPLRKSVSSFLQLSSSKLTVRQNKNVSLLPSFPKDSLTVQTHEVSFPSLKDIDKILRGQNVFAQTKTKEQQLFRLAPALNSRNFFSQFQRKIILVSSIFVSSFLFGIWGVMLKKRFLK